MLACTEQRNITIVFESVYKDFYDEFLYRLEEILENEAYFMMNILSSSLR